MSVQYIDITTVSLKFVGLYLEGEINVSYSFPVYSICVYISSIDLRNQTHAFHVCLISRSWTFFLTKLSNRWNKKRIKLFRFSEYENKINWLKIIGECSSVWHFLFSLTRYSQLQSSLKSEELNRGRCSQVDIVSISQNKLLKFSTNLSTQHEFLK